MAQKSKTTGPRRGNRPLRRKRGGHFWKWIAIVVALVIGLGVLNLWRSGAFASPPPPSRTGDPATLLPLTQAGPLLRGGYDPALIPETPPTPQPVPANEPVPRLDMPERNYDFGRIYARWTVSHIFPVRTRALPTW